MESTHSQPEPYEAKHRETPELLRLQYPEGWREILTAPDAIDYQMWLSELSDTTIRVSLESGRPPEWASDPERVLNRWQRAIELVADAAIDPDSGLTQAERVETAMLTLQANIESIGWEEKGLSFIVPNLITGEAAQVDLREVASAQTE